ncbi:hypothetical protein ON010_g2081 [Phytophthora cinnamomi]|nr:hypothetical protein ON010_g2081 [Phytophthora cinnamomi]
MRRSESTLPPPARHEYHQAEEEKCEDIVESSERADALLAGHDFVRTSASASADAASLYLQLDSITLGDVEVIMEELTSSERAGDDQCTEQHTEQVQNEKKIFLYIKDLPGSSFKYKQLRFLCKKLCVHGYKNKTKAAMVDLIIQRKINESSYDALFEKKKKTRSDPPLKQKQCPFRLLNVLFSDEFAGRLASLGDVNPAIIVYHCAEKLQQIWKNLLKDYMQMSRNRGFARANRRHERIYLQIWAQQLQQMIKRTFIHPIIPLKRASPPLDCYVVAPNDPLLTEIIFSNGKRLRRCSDTHDNVIHLFNTGRTAPFLVVRID